MANTVSSSDLGVLFGYGLFETIRIYDNVPFLFDEHLQRLTNSAKILNINGFSYEKAKNLFQEYTNVNDTRSYALRLSFTNGNPQEKVYPAYFLKRSEIQYTQSNYKVGVSATISNFRKNEHSEIVRHKTLNFLENYLALQLAKSQSVKESIFLNTSGYLSEGSVSNLFFVSKNIIKTPSLLCGILPGITRNFVLLLANKEAIKTEEGVYTLECLLKSDECFLTNSLMEVMPLVSVGGVKIGNGVPGNVTKIIHNLYKKSVKTYVEDSKDRELKDV